MQTSLVIGNKNYSSWSLRAWLLLAEAGIEFSEQRIPLDIESTATELARFSPSGRVPVPEATIAPALEQCSPDEGINFVTHSLGGILVRQYLSNHEIPNLKRVVMLGPPNQGSEVVDKMKKFPGFHFINGDAGMQLGTGELSIPNQLGKAEFDVGIVAGTRSINWILSWIIPSTDDGKVSVERTKLEGMNDHIEMKVTHPFMMKNDEVIAQVVHYLKNGTFKR